MTQSIRYLFPKSIRLLRRKQFRKMGYGCDRCVGKFIIVDLKKNFLTHSRLGITATKKYGRAHARNRFKRLAREAFRLCSHSLVKGYDLVVRPRSTAHNAITPNIIEELVQLIGGSLDFSGNVCRAERSQRKSKKSS